ncbi:MAG: hypothetical protein NTY68_01385 [Candidatus Micrarchaeota archaeon]|nr:hypothetical protein [Candidatus Micrarchaeota archaeon]
MEEKLPHMKIICIISFIGVLFSGYFSYIELAEGKCPIGGCASILNIPICIYGFIMFLMLFITSILGIRHGSAIMCP